MSGWKDSTAEDIRIGNIISHRHIIDEVESVRTSPKPGYVFLMLKDNAPIEMLREESIEVFR